MYANRILMFSKLNFFKSLFKNDLKLLSRFLNDVNKNDNGIQFPDIDLSTCCGRGCANCVWLQYSTRLSELYQNDKKSSIKLKEAIEKIEDETLKAFLLFELRDKL